MNWETPLNTTRYRSRTSEMKRLSTYTWFNKQVSDGSIVSEIERSSPTPDAEMTSEEMWDTSNSGALTAMKMGEVIMNDMQQESIKVIRNHPATSGKIEPGPNGPYQESVVFGALYTYGALGEDVFPPEFEETTTASDVGRMCDLALSRLYSEVGKAPYDWLASMAELPKTVRTIHRCLAAAQSLFGAVKNGHIRYIKGAITAAQAADVYLEVRYGLRPLIYEIKQAIEAIDTYGDNHRLNLSFYDTLPEVREQLPEMGDYIGNPNYQPLYMYSDIVDTYNATVHVGAVLNFKTETQGAVDVLGFDNILETALELYPLSFMADWFINLSQWVGQWTPEMNVEVLGSYLTLEEIKSRNVTANRIYALLYGENGKAWYEGVEAPASWSTIERTRTRRYANPQKPWFPRVKMNLSGLKVADMIAIFGGYVTDLRRWKI